MQVIRVQGRLWLPPAVDGLRNLPKQKTSLGLDNIHHKHYSGEHPFRRGRLRSEERVKHVRRATHLGFVDGTPVAVDAHGGRMGQLVESCPAQGS